MTALGPQRCSSPDQLGRIASFFLGGSALILMAPWSAAIAQGPVPTGALAVATRLVEAFNQHDPAAMAALVTGDFELYYVDESGVASLGIQGAEQLAAEMTSYFAARPTVRSTISAAIDGPVFVSFREQTVGGQSSLAVYEVRDGLIRRAWYFPAED